MTDHDISERHAPTRKPTLGFTRKTELPPMPLPTDIGGTYFFTRRQAEEYKSALLGIEPPAAETKIELLTVKVFAAELSRSTKWVKREIWAAQKAAADAKADPAPSPVPAPVKRRRVLENA